MDWYSWLSKTNLDPLFLYEYSIAFAQNQLQEEDLAYFTHEFLQSIGVYVAKHRIEIIKLARKDVRVKPSALWRFVSTMSKTKKLFSRNIGKLSFRKTDPFPNLGLSPAQNEWAGALRRINEASKNNEQQKKMMDRRRIMKSGPLDRMKQENAMVTNMSVSVSGPLDGKAIERVPYPNWSPLGMTPMGRRANGRMGCYCRSPAVSFPVDKWGLSPNVKFCSSEKRGYDNSGDNSLWSLMFQDMKPT